MRTAVAQAKGRILLLLEHSSLGRCATETRLAARLLHSMLHSSWRLRDLSSVHSDSQLSHSTHRHIACLPVCMSLYFSVVLRPVRVFLEPKSNGHAHQTTTLRRARSAVQVVVGRQPHKWNCDGRSERGGGGEERERVDERHARCEATASDSSGKPGRSSPMALSMTHSKWRW